MRLLGGNNKSGDNNYQVKASRFETMIKQTLKDVSTKHLQNYANFFSLTETNKAKDANKLATLSILKDKEGWNKFTNAEAAMKNLL